MTKRAVVIMATRHPQLRHRRADRTRVGGAARLQQPHRLAPDHRPPADRARRGADQVGCVRDFTPQGRQPLREQLLTLSRPRLHLDLLHPRGDGAAAALRRDREAEARHRRRPHVLALAEHLRRRRRAASASSPRWSATACTRRGSRRCASTCSARPRRAPAPRAPRRSAALEGRRSCIVMRAGGPEVLQRAHVHGGRAAGRARCACASGAIGVNYIDVYTRTGTYPPARPPGVPGVEAAGTWSTSARASRALRRAIASPMPARRRAPMPACARWPPTSSCACPSDVDRRERGGGDAQGHDGGVPACSARTACSPATRSSCTRRPAPRAIRRQWARALGARVIGTVGSEGKARIARDTAAKWW